MEGMLVDTEHYRTVQRETFVGFSGCKLSIDAADSCRGELLEPAHDGTGDAFVVKGVDVLSEGFAGMAPRQDPWQWFHEGAHARFASEATAANLEPS
jgi:hypothetical protein